MTTTKKGTAPKTSTKTAPKASTKAKKEAAPREPKAKKKEKPPKEPKVFAHDPRVLPFIDKTLTHTERDGTVHECKVLEGGFEVDGERYNSATKAAQPFQPIKDGKPRAVNGLVYWNIVKTPRPAISPEAALEGAQKAVERAVEKCAAAVEAAGEKKGDVRRTIQSAVNKFEKLLKQAAA